MKELTKRQRQILDYISDYICTEGYPPTIREIGEAMGIRSTNGVSDHLIALSEKGYIERDGLRSRTMRPCHLPKTPRGVMEVKVLGQVTAGVPRLAVEDDEAETLCIDRDLVGNNRDVFALRIDGDSMINDKICDGDLVFVQRRAHANAGDIVIALIDDEATCKRYYPEPEQGRIRFQPANDALEPIYVSEREFKETTILGVVVGVYHSI